MSLARALVLGPKLLVADEPTAGVDLTVRDAVVDVVAELKRAGDFSAVVISHDLAVLRQLTDQIVVLHGGNVVALGSIDDVWHNRIIPLLWVSHTPWMIFVPADERRIDPLVVLVRYFVFLGSSIGRAIGC